MPACGKRPGLGFPITDNRGDDQVRIVKRGTEGMRERISQFAAFMDTAWRFWRHVAGNTARKAELLEQFLHPAFVLRDFRVRLCVCAFEVSVSDQRRSSMTGAGNKQDIEILLRDDSVEMDINKVQARRCAPMTEQSGLDVFPLQRLSHEGISEQIDLTN